MIEENDQLVPAIPECYSHIMTNPEFLVREMIDHEILGVTNQI